MIFTISTLVTEINKKVVLKRILYIHYLFRFCKNKKNKIQVLIDSGSEVNAIISTYVAKPGPKFCCINIKAEKINGSIFNIFGIILTSFQVENKLGRVCFFKEIFLLADMSMELALEMFFLTFSNTNIKFTKKILI